jgi:hypothetical protein
MRSEINADDYQAGTTMKRLSYILLAGAMLFVACSLSSGPDVEGRWMNGDGNLVRFESGGKAWVGQQGYENMDECTWTLSGDTIVVVTEPEGPDSLHNTYRLLLEGDTLHLVMLSLHAIGVQEDLAIEEFARRSGKSREKLAFVRREETK